MPARGIANTPPVGSTAARGRPMSANIYTWRESEERLWVYMRSWKLWRIMWSSMWAMGSAMRACGSSRPSSVWAAMTCGYVTCFNSHSIVIVKFHFLSDAIPGRPTITLPVQRWVGSTCFTEVLRFQPMKAYLQSSGYASNIPPIPTKTNHKP